MKVSAFVPLKLNSRRLPNKNFLRLGNRPLASHIFESLLEVDLIESVFCYTSQPQVMRLLPDRLELLMRPKYLDGDEVKANELFHYAVDNIDADIIVLCHATGPFIKPESIQKGLEAVLSGKYDCAFAAQELKTYCWYKDKPLNYLPSNMTQTQDLVPVYAETSGFYIFKKSDYLNTNTRIGNKPFIVPVDFRESVDIDEPKDFALASWLYDFNPMDLKFNNDSFFVDMAHEGAIHKNIEHICFDLDGVLIDSIEIMEGAWNFSCESMGINIPFSEYKKGIGMPFEVILDLVGIESEKHQDFKNIYDEFSEKNIELIKLPAEVRDSLKRLKDENLKISVVTSKCKYRTKNIMDKFFKSDDFDIVLSPDDVPSGRGKPHPDPLLFVCAVLGVDPYNSLYVGDMKTDKTAAKRAGYHFIYANWGYGDLQKVKDVWFNSLKDLTDYILL